MFQRNDIKRFNIRINEVLYDDLTGSITINFRRFEKNEFSTLIRTYRIQNYDKIQG